MHKEYLDSYLYYITLEKKLSKGTTDMYIKEIEIFFNFIKRNADVDMETLVEEERFIKEYIYKLVKEDKNNERTVNRKITILKGFFDYILSSPQFPKIKSTPMLRIKSQKTEKTIPVFLTLEECEKLFYGVKFFSRYSLRDYAIFQFFISTGARVSEVCKLELNQLNLQSGTVKLYGKGRKERIVALTESATEALKTYLESGDNKDLSKKGRVPKIDTNIVFLSKYGKPFTEKGIYMLFINLTKKIGIYRKGLSPHKLRHTFATLLLNNGCNIVDLQSLLGHSSLNSTEIYTHIIEEEVISKVRAAHPLNRKHIDNDFIKRVQNIKK